MDAALITAIVGALAVLGTGAKYLIDRMDRKREKRETAVEELLKAQAAKAERRYARLTGRHNTPGGNRAQPF